MAQRSVEVRGSQVFVSVRWTAMLASGASKPAQALLTEWNRARARRHAPLSALRIVRDSGCQFCMKRCASLPSVDASAATAGRVDNSPSVGRIRGWRPSRSGRQKLGIALLAVQRSRQMEG